MEKKKITPNFLSKTSDGMGFFCLASDLSKVWYNQKMINDRGKI